MKTRAWKSNGVVKKKNIENEIEYKNECYMNGGALPTLLKNEILGK